MRGYIRKAKSRGWVIGQVLVITLVGVWSHVVDWLVCGRTPSADHGEGRDERLKNFKRRNHYK